MTNASKAALPAGPPGYNGTQDPVGPPGPPGYGNLTLCSYKTGASPGQSPDTYANQEVQRTETNVGFKVTTVKSDFFTIKAYQLYLDTNFLDYFLCCRVKSFLVLTVTRMTQNLCNFQALSLEEKENTRALARKL